MTTSDHYKCYELSTAGPMAGPVRFGVDILLGSVLAGRTAVKKQVIGRHVPQVEVGGL
jgi:hypothetical protein